MIALHPRFDRRQHAERLLPSHFVVASRAVMRRTGLPGGLQDVLPSEQQSRALRTADGLAAAVRDDGGAALQVHVGNRQHFGGRIDEDGDVLRSSDPCHRFEHGIGPAVGHQVDHRRARIDGALELFDRLDGHHSDADVANRMVVDVSRDRGNVRPSV